MKYGDVVQISPFFYYQFYHFDERYSVTQAGKSPVFEDTMSYEVNYDAKLIHYLQKEPLEIILFDDSAPITGLSRGAQAPGEQSDDMIGSAQIPLSDLIKGANVHDRFPIRKLGALAGASIGTIEIKISVLDIEPTANANNVGRTAQQATSH